MFMVGTVLAVFLVTGIFVIGAKIVDFVTHVRLSVKLTPPEPEDESIWEPME